MKKLLLLALVLMGKLTTASAYDITFYYAVDASTVGSYSVKLNKNSGTGWGLHEMEKTDKTINGRYIYSCSYTDTSDKIYELQIQFHDANGWHSQVVALQNNSGENLSDFNGKMYVYKDNDNKGWTLYNYDTTPKSVTIHCKKTDSWTPNYGYAFYHNGFENILLTAGWTGDKISANANNSDYYDLSISTSVNSVTVIFNNGNSGQGSNQTWDISIDSNAEYWTMGDDSKGGYAAGPECWKATTEAPDGWIGYTRAVTPDNYGTICFPYSGTVSGATLYQIDSKIVVGGELKGINISSVVNNSLTAGQAYIFKASDSQLTVSSLSDTYTDAITGGAMVGNVSSTPASVETGKYIIKNNKLYQAETGVTIGQYRAYIDLTNVAVAQSRGANSIYFGDDATGIESVQNENNENVMFNMQGQRVNNAQKGLVIVGGKKMLRK